MILRNKIDSIFFEERTNKLSYDLLIKLMVQKPFSIIFIVLIMLFAGIVLTLSLRGTYGSPTEATMNTQTWGDEGPLELSPERGRFALAMSVIENQSTHFSVPIARFATPDLGFKDGKYVSLFAPGVSYIIMPGYLIGRALGISQVGSYAVIALFALLNTVLIYAIARKLHATLPAALLGGLTFLFATPAFAYAVSLYQHHVSTFLLLASIYVLLRFQGLWPLLVVWFLAMAAIPMDYPNMFLFIPIVVYALGRIFVVAKTVDTVRLRVHLIGAITVISALLPLYFFTEYNRVTYGKPLQLAGTVAVVKAIDENGNPAVPKNQDTTNERDELIDPSKQGERQAQAFFKPRNLLSGSYIQFLSSDRGVVWYAPVTLLGIAGLYYLYKRHPKAANLLGATIGLNVLLYGMWGDPWGGWAFGLRYLIPSYALLAICVAYLLAKFQKHWIVIVAFYALFIYGVSVNTLGALTSNRNPPKVEVLNLEKLSGREEKYTFERNYDMLVSGRTKSYVYNTYIRGGMKPFSYYLSIVGVMAAIMAILVALNFIVRRAETE